MARKIERTIAIVKPDGMDHLLDIASIFMDNGLDIETADIKKLDKKLLDKHYKGIKDEKDYPQICEHMLSGMVAIMVLKGEDAVNKLKTIIGSNEEESTIRGIYGTDSIHNAIEGSLSLETAKKEIRRFFPQGYVKR